MNPAASPAQVTRVRIAFSKLEAMRFTGNLDLHETWERLRRGAGLPLAYSEGFRPHPRIHLASALALGCTSSGELIDVWLERPLEPDKIVAALRSAIPPGLPGEEAWPVALRGPAPPTLGRARGLLRGLRPRQDRAGLGGRPDGLAAAPRLPRERPGKPYDLRPLV